MANEQSDIEDFVARFMIARVRGGLETTLPLYYETKMARNAREGEMEFMKPILKDDLGLLPDREMQVGYIEGRVIASAPKITGRIVGRFRRLLQHSMDAAEARKYIKVKRVPKYAIDWAALRRDYPAAYLAALEELGGIDALYVEPIREKTVKSGKYLDKSQGGAA